ncbi:hypothetical protein [Actinocorallia populi]|uniref:hypothetical protein n=1 Tax=Actinocorallia populi TaxID=2079200 RepID=UPI000D091643|nr:hypothetical protein [Actinocorallia populi]
MSAPSQESIRRTRSIGVSVLLIAGANGLLFNLHHALHLETANGEPLPTELAVAFGTIPVVLAGGMSVLAVQTQFGKFLKSLIWAVVLGTISLSVVAQYDVLIDYLGNQAIALIYPIVGDVATIVALEVVIHPDKAAKVLDKLQSSTETEPAVEAPAEPAPAAFVFPAPRAEDTFVEAAPVTAGEPEPVIEAAPAISTVPVVAEPAAEPTPAPAAVEPVKPVAEANYSAEELDQALLIDADHYDKTGRRASADLLAKEMQIGLRKARALRDRIKARPVQDRDADMEVES